MSKTGLTLLFRSYLNVHIYIKLKWHAQKNQLKSVSNTVCT